MPRYVVRATLGSHENRRRVTSRKKFNTKSAAQRYADETNKFYNRANARVSKAKELPLRVKRWKYGTLKQQSKYDEYMNRRKK